MSAAVSRRAKWHPAPPPPPSPKILHFPRRRRTRSRKPTKPRDAPFLIMNQSSNSNLESLFDDENHRLPPPPELFNSKRERVEEHRSGFSAERELASKKLEKQRVKMERALRSGRKKMVEAKSNAVLEEEIEDLTEKLDELQYKLRTKGCSNFDNKACHLGQVSNTNHEQEEEARAQENKCSGRCKAVVLRIVEQVRAETEQWSQMQAMLEQVRGEMEELQASRDYWETRSYTSEFQIQSLRHSVEEWKQKALDYEKEVHQLENKLSLKMEAENSQKRAVPLLSLAKQLAKEKRSFLKEKTRSQHPSIFGAFDRSPLREIGNSRQNHRAAFDYHSPERSRIRESFRK
ncbi:hypothetical protein AAHA92_23918 [Salvia divinorum]|uniref:Uncharacterized protein n=1 Tax=Salvia divinorum TaxID=28513 RepID=A0ABD1GTG5_SALDI